MPCLSVVDQFAQKDGGAGQGQTVEDRLQCGECQTLCPQLQHRGADELGYDPTAAEIFKILPYFPIVPG